MEATAERTRDACVVIINVDKSVGWSDIEADSAVPGLRSIGISRLKKSGRLIPVAVVRIPRVLEEWVVRVERTAPAPEERIVMEESAGDGAIAIATMEVTTTIVIEVSATIIAPHRVGVGIPWAGWAGFAGPRSRCPLRMSPATCVPATMALREHGWADCGENERDGDCRCDSFETLDCPNVDGIHGALLSTLSRAINLPVTKSPKCGAKRSHRPRQPVCQRTLWSAAIV